MENNETARNNQTADSVKTGGRPDRKGREPRERGDFRDNRSGNSEKADKFDKDRNVKDRNDKDRNNRDRNNRDRNNRDRTNRDRYDRDKNDKKEGSRKFQKNGKEPHNGSKSQPVNKNGGKENKPRRPKQPYAHKGMVYQHREGGPVHDWNCPEVKGASLDDLIEMKEIPLLTGCLCPKCGRGLLLKKYTDDKEEGRALSRFLGDNGLSIEFLCELYEVHHVYPYVYNGEMKMTCHDQDWKIQKSEDKLVVFHNEFGENMPGWFNDYWKEYQVVESGSFEEAIKLILEKSAD